MTKIEVGIKGRYKLQVFKRGELARESGWFDNLITNLGMDQIGNQTGFALWGQVGSSSATPAFTDTQLGSRITSAQASTGQRFRIDSAQRYAIHTWVYTFLAGSAAGNIAEVGVSLNNAGTLLSSRALVVDSAGNPTVVTVLPDEELVLLWELWVKQPTDDFVDVLPGRTFTTRAANVDTVDVSDDIMWQKQIAFILTTRRRSYAGGVGPITGLPSGTSVISTGPSVTNAYIPGEHKRTGRLTWSANEANTYPVRSFTWVFGLTAWQTECNPPMPLKNNEQTLRFDLQISWSRDSGPA